MDNVTDINSKRKPEISFACCFCGEGVTNELTIWIEAEKLESDNGQQFWAHYKCFVTAMGEDAESTHTIMRPEIAKLFNENLI